MQIAVVYIFCGTQFFRYEIVLPEAISTKNQQGRREIAHRKDHRSKYCVLKTDALINQVACGLIKQELSGNPQLMKSC